MKSVMIIIDGLGDEPLAELGGRTPLEAAYIPNIQYLASNGEIGRVKTTYTGFPIESMVCIMGLIGYEPEKFYPAGRASFEATAKGIPVYDGDLILRCNILTADLEKQTLLDFTAGQISDNNARKIISKIKLPYDNWELYPGQSYRNILVIRNANVDVHKIKCYEPHMNIGSEIDKTLPVSHDTAATKLVSQISDFLLDTQKQIKEMNLESDCKGNMLWVWSPSKKANLPTFKKRTGLNAVFVGGLDFLHGIAMSANIDFEIIPGATGYIDTDYSAKAKYAINYLENYDFVLVHINAADEEAHLRNYRGKIEAIEKVDKFIVAPLIDVLRKNYADNFRIAVLGDHVTKCIDGKHGEAPVPYVLYGHQIQKNSTLDFCEKNTFNFDPILSLDFLGKLAK